MDNILNQIIANGDCLYTQWEKLKYVEKWATNYRRVVEDNLTTAYNLEPTFEGTKTIEANGFKVKITARMNRKIDADKLQEIATEHNLTNHLRTLFRWKPEINASAFKAADQAITKPLLAAITTEQSRPTYSISKD